MNGQLKETNRRWNARHISPLLKIALLLGVLIHLSGFFIFRVVSNPLPSIEQRPAYISLVPTSVEDGKDELIEQASLFDSAPLFIPGEWNSVSRLSPSKTFQDWQVFPDFEPSLELMDEVRPERLAAPQVADVKQPSDLLDLRFLDLFSYFGYGEVSVAKQESWSSLAEVSVLSGKNEYSPDFRIRLEADLELEEFGRRPVVFFLNMHAPGLPVSDPLLKQSSGSDALDTKALSWLIRPETLARLPAGFLEVRIFH